MARMNGLRIGIYADVENTSRQGGRTMRYKALRDFACRDGAEPLRLNAYLAYDDERGRRDAVYRESKRSFHNALRDHGFKVIEKSVKWYTSDEGEPVSKANSDLDLAVDMLMQSDRLDRVVLVSGDGDFARVVNAVQGKGCRVEVVAFESVSYDLRRECDSFTSGHLIPGLLPVKGPAWGELGSRVRGTCCSFREEKGYGFLQFFAGPTAENPEQREIFFHRTDGPADLDFALLPSRDLVFEFTLTEDKSGKPAAREVQLVTSYNGNGKKNGHR
jgi:uncharacterized LabA/DUF88 family protein